MFLFSLYMRQTDHKSSLSNVKFGNIQADQSENTTSRLLLSLCFSKTALDFLSVLSFIRFFFEFLLCRFGFFFQKSYVQLLVNQITTLWWKFFIQVVRIIIKTHFLQPHRYFAGLQ
ncbi:hypothetical protein EV202_11229 [Bacteroides heparinolyticus]|uniref:Uncharacterized protein n=1 Tax=Prevotella heparinolytica TaxID=28113 RepID=A0A4R2LRX4_9BACE|nr:hypothetical protein EV202_11229 [Bacteroides heparinolyticus]